MSITDTERVCHVCARTFTPLEVYFMSRENTAYKSYVVCRQTDGYLTVAVLFLISEGEEPQGICSPPLPAFPHRPLGSCRLYFPSLPNYATPALH
jgi:hypothetical protein